ncbi:unnamed protein product [Diamesa serratosioi]
MDLIVNSVKYLVTNTKLIYYALILAGVWAVMCWSIDNLKSVIQIIQSILTPYFRPHENKSLIERYGKWAVITGSTDGIGKQYAKELASQGMNIVLISRTESKLKEVASEIESMYSVKTKYIIADFSAGKAIYDDIKKQLIDMDIGVLVNNVGRMYDFPDDLDHISEDLLWQIININVGAVTMMSRILIPQMKQNARGIIVNVSSGSECQPAPLMTVYASSKVYVKNFTLAIRKELEPFNVQVQLVTPMFVLTKMNEYSTSVMKGNILIPDVESYTRSAVFTLGKSSKTTGYWSHGLQYGLIKLVPESVRTVILMSMNRQFREEYFQQNRIMSN